MCLVALGLWLSTGRPAAVADTWHRVASPNFTVVSNAGEGAARNVAWQFEQIRSAVQAGWSWARAELDRPFLVFALKNENTMKTFAPAYWEARAAVKPSSVAAPGQDRYYVLLRTDVRNDSAEGVSPYQSAYWNYTSLVLSDRFEGLLPLWFGRGLSAVLSNTIVTNKEVQFGRAIPWYLAEIQRGGRLSLSELFAMTRQSPAYLNQIERRRFDAQTWALVHFLVFGDADLAASGARVNEVVRLTIAGMPSDQAMTQVYGSLDVLDEAYRRYVGRGLFRSVGLKVNAEFDKDGFGASQVSAAEAAALRAGYLVTTNRVGEARAAIDEAKALDPDLAEAFQAEGRLADRERDTETGKAAYEQAVALGASNFYPYLRLANLMPRQGASAEDLSRTRQLLEQAVERNPASGLAYQSLGNVLLQMNDSAAAVVALQKGAAIDPLQLNAHFNLANALLRVGQREAALAEARAALGLARTEQQRQLVQRLLERIGG